MTSSRDIGFCARMTLPRSLNEWASFVWADTTASYCGSSSQPLAAFFSAAAGLASASKAAVTHSRENRTWSLGDYALVGKRLDFLKLAVPTLARVAAIVNPDDPTDRMEMTQLPKAASGLGLALQFIEVHNAAELESAAAEVVRAGVQGMYLSQGPTLSRRQIAAMVERLKLPAIHGFRTFVDTGGLLSYGPNLPELYRQSARLVDRISQGKRPAGRQLRNTWMARRA
jgi:putative ABC transport system substrate-binding protein